MRVVTPFNCRDGRIPGTLYILSRSFLIALINLVGLAFLCYACMPENSRTDVNAPKIAITIVVSLAITALFTIVTFNKYLLLGTAAIYLPTYFVAYVLRDQFNEPLGVTIAGSLITITSLLILSSRFLPHQKVFGIEFGTCPRCGYDVAHARHTRCPECGEEISYLTDPSGEE